MSYNIYMVNWKRKEKKFRKKHKVGLCLSGGGTRGFAFLGVFKAFEENGITFDMVAGTSVGSLFGAMYSAGLTYEEMLKYASKLKTNDFKRTKLAFLPSKLDGLQNIINSILPDQRIEDLSLPFFAVAVDLRTGKEVDFSSGELAPILAGSCSVPWVFVPVKYKNMLLVDGMVLNNVPADVLLDNGCDYVVTVDCNSSRVKGTNSNNIFTLAFTSMNIMMSNTSSKGKKISDILIELDLSKFSPMSVKGREEMIEIGYNATIKKIDEIKALFTGGFNKKKK